MFKKLLAEGLSLVLDKGKAGVMDAAGNLLLPCAYEMVAYVPEYSQFIIRQKGLFGLADTDGTILAKPKYGHITRLFWKHSRRSNSLNHAQGYAIQGTAGFGWLSIQGKEIVPPIYKVLGKFNEQYMEGYDSQEYWHALYRTDGKTPIPQGLGNYSDAGGGLIWAKTQLEKYRVANMLFDRDGKALTPHIFNQVGNFSEGFAWVQLHELAVYLYANKDQRKLSKKLDYGYLDGLELKSALTEDEISFNEQKGLYCFVDQKGRLINKRVYDDVEWFCESLAPIQVEGLWGFIGTDGSEVIAPQYDAVNDFRNGYARVWQDEKCGLIDQTGKIVIPLEYDFLGNVNACGLLLFRSHIGEFGCLDLENRKYSFQPCEEGKQFRLCDQDGNPAPAKQMTALKPNAEGFEVVVFEDKAGLIDNSWNVIIPPEYDYLSMCWGGIGYLKKDGKFAFYNSKGELVTPFVYDNASLVCKGACSGTIGSKRVLVTEKGAVTEPLFAWIGSEETYYDYENKVWTHCDGLDWIWDVQQECFALNNRRDGKENKILSRDIEAYDPTIMGKRTGAVYLKTNLGYVSLDGRIIRKDEVKPEALVSPEHPAALFHRTPPDVIRDAKIAGLKNKISKVPNVEPPTASMPDYLDIHNHALLERMEQYEVRFLVGLYAGCLEWIAWRLLNVGQKYLNYEFLFQRIEALYAASVDSGYAAEGTFNDQYRAVRKHAEQQGADDKEISQLEYLSQVLRHWGYLYHSYQRKNREAVVYRAAGIVILCRAALPKSKTEAFNNWLEDVLTRAQDYYGAVPVEGKSRGYGDVLYNDMLNRVVPRTFFFAEDYQPDILQNDQTVSAFLESLDWAGNPYLDQEYYREHPFMSFQKIF